MGERNRQQRQGDDDDTDDTSDSNKESVMSKEDIRRLVVSTVNGTVEKTVKKTFEGLNLGAQIQEAISGALGPVTEKLSALEAGGGKQAGNGNQGQGAPTIPPELQKQLKDMEKRLADSDAARLKAEEEGKAATEKGRRKEERDALSAALRKAGVPDALAGAAVAMLSEKGIVKRGDDDGIGWYHEDEVLPLDKGVATWMKGEGKEFLPARPVNGSGAGRNGQIQHGQKMSKGDQIAADVAALAGLPDF